MINYNKPTVCHIAEYTCPLCGKIFFPSLLHRYKNPKTHDKYCSWTCYRVAQKNSPRDFINIKRKVKD